MRQNRYVYGLVHMLVLLTAYKLQTGFYYDYSFDLCRLFRRVPRPL